MAMNAVEVPEGVMNPILEPRTPGDGAGKSKYSGTAINTCCQLILSLSCFCYYCIIQHTVKAVLTAWCLNSRVDFAEEIFCNSVKIRFTNFLARLFLGFPGLSVTRVDLLQSLETVAALDSLPLPDHAPAIEAEAVAIDYQVCPCPSRVSLIELPIFNARMPEHLVAP